MSDIDFLETVCERMQQVGLVTSKAEFSVDMLGKAPSYLTSMKARERNVSDDVTNYLEARLKADIKVEGQRISSLKSQVQQEELRQKHRLDLIGWIERQRRYEANVSEPDLRPTQPRRKTLISPLSSLFDWLRVKQGSSFQHAKPSTRSRTLK